MLETYYKNQDKFRNGAIKKVGLEGHPMADEIFLYAKNSADPCGGDSAVLEELEELVELLNDFKNGGK